MDIAKQILQVHSINLAGTIVIRRDNVEHRGAFVAEYPNAPVGY
jgi:hypothetical protein